MKIILSILLSLFSLVGMAQVFQTNSAPYYYPKGLKTGLLIGPKGCGAPASISNPIYGQSSGGAMYVDTCNNVLYIFNGVAWKNVLSTADTNFIRNLGTYQNKVFNIESGTTNTFTTNTLDILNLVNRYDTNSYKPIVVNTSTGRLDQFAYWPGSGSVASTDNLDSVVSRGNWTDDSINIKGSSTGANVVSITRIPSGGYQYGTIKVSNTQPTATAELLSDALIFKNSGGFAGAIQMNDFVTNNSTFFLPDTVDQTLAVGVKVNGTTYMTSSSGIADLGTIGGGVTKVGTIGSTPNANGATISNDTLYLQPASSSFGGVLTNGVQEIAGGKRIADLRTSSIVPYNTTNGFITLTTFSANNRTGNFAINGGDVGQGTLGRSMVGINGSFTGTSGEIQANALRIFPTINRPTVTNLHFVGIRYEPTVTAMADNHIALLLKSGDFVMGADSALPSAIVDINSTTKGALLPRMNTANQNAISSPATGLLIWNTDTLDLMTYNGSAWVRSGGGSSPTDYHQSIVSINDSTVKFTKPNGNSDTLTVVTYALTANAINYSATGTNANITAVSGTAYYLPPATLSQNRTFTMPTGSELDLIEIYNLEAGYLWNLAGGAVYLSDGVTAVTFLTANTNYLIRKIGNKWRILN